MDIGDLTGRIAIEDQFSSVLDMVVRRVESFADDFEGALGGIAVGVGVAVTAITAMTAAVTALAVKGSDVNDVAGTFEHFAETAGGAEATLDALRSGVQGTLDDMTLMKDANKLLSIGVKMTAEDFGLLSQASFVLQNRGLGDTKEMLDLVSQALVTGRTRTLAMKLGVVDAADAEQKYADRLGILKSQLTETQTAESKRIAIMDMLRGVVTEAGEQQLDYGEKIESAQASLTNWIEKLESIVATSPSVGKAIDTVTTSFSRISNSEAVLNAVVGAVNLFADAVTNILPKIVTLATALGTIAETAYNFKEVTIALVAAYYSWNAVMRVAEALVERDIILREAQAAAYAAETTTAIALKNAHIAEAEVVATTSAVKIGALTTLRTAVQAVAVEWGLMNDVVFEGVAATATTLGVIAGVTVAVAAAVAVVIAGYQAWKLWSENSERAAAATRQATIDSSNLAILNEKLGTSFTDINAASAEWIKRNKDAKPAIDEHSQAIAAAAAQAKAYKEAVQGVVDSVTIIGQQLNVERDAYQKLGDQILFTTEGQDKFIASMEKITESGRVLIASEQRRVDLILEGRIATTQFNESLLRHRGITLEVIESAKALGLTEAELALRWGVSTGALKAYETEMQTTKKLHRELADLQMELSGSVADKAISDHKREADDAILTLNVKSATYTKDVQDYRDAQSKKDELTIRSLGTSISGSRQAADAALSDYNRMVASGNFYREELDKQLAKYFELKDAATRHGQAAVGAETAATEATRKHNEELDKQKAVQDAIIANDALIRSRSASFEVTANNLAQAISETPFSVYDMQTGHKGGSAYVSQATDLAREGYSFSEIIAILKGGPKNEPIGPAIPGFGKTGAAANAPSPTDRDQVGTLSLVNSSGTAVAQSNGYGLKSGTVSSQAEFDRLNEEQASLWNAGKVSSIAYKDIVDRMSRMPQASDYGLTPSPGPITFNFNGITTDEAVNKVKQVLIKHVALQKQLWLLR